MKYKVFLGIYALTELMRCDYTSHCQWRMHVIFFAKLSKQYLSLFDIATRNILRGVQEDPHFLEGMRKVSKLSL